MTQTDRLTGQRKALMMSCASLALATAALYPQPARAQQALGAFRGDITGITGTVSRTPTSNTTETITIGSTNATINWRPSDHGTGGGTIDFLPSANTATFTSAQGVTDYTVLNRILPDDSSRGIALNGHVISTLQGTQATGGRIWFYSPGGILIGATAVIDVGSLLLTTNDVTNFSTNANGFSAYFAGPAASAAKVQVAKGAQINALQQNSYIAMVAPRIEQRGKVRVNGSAAYAAGEQLAMTMNQGLFDIQVDVGTTDSNGIVHSGETSGPASATAADNHKIYMVAVPKNQALTMLLGGKVGFDDAVNASVKNGEIILGSGYDIVGGAFVESTSGTSNFNISDGSFTSDVEGHALGDVTVRPTGSSTINFAGDLQLFGRDSVLIAADAGKKISVGGNLQAASFANTVGQPGRVSLEAAGAGSAISVDGTTELRADFFNLFTTNTVGRDQSYNFTAEAIPSAGTVTVQASGGAHLTFTGAATLGAEGLQPDGNPAFGGSVQVLANGGATIDFNTDVHIDTTSFGGYPTNGIGGDAIGGYSEMTADGGAIHVAGGVTLFADGLGGGTNTINPATQGGNGAGGRAVLQALNDGSISIGGATTVTADATGGENVAPSGNADFSGAASGGTASLIASGGTITLGQAANISASATGGNNDSPTGLAGHGYGGTAQILVDAGGSIIGASDLSVTANGNGGNAALNAGYGEGGFAEVVINGGSVSAGGALGVFADGNGGTGQIAGDGFGGSASLSITGGEGIGSGGTLRIASDFRVQASGQGGEGADNAEGAGGDGGDGYAGSALFYVSPYQQDGATIVVDLADTFVDNNGEGGNGGDGLTGGNGGMGCGSGACGFDGETSHTGEALAELFAGTVTTHELQVFSTARGGQGGAGSDGAGGNGGAAFGGRSTLTIATAVSSTNALSYDRALAGNGGEGTTAQGNGGAAAGGNAEFTILGGGHLSGNADVNTSAFGGAGNAGGIAEGGNSVLEVAGTLSGGLITVKAEATGGAGLTGGDGSGGSAIFNIGGGLVTASGDTNVTAIGFGGNGLANASGTGGLGGDGFGGSAAITVSGADAPTLDDGGPQVALGIVSVNSKGEGGTGGSGAVGGAGGTGEAGESSLAVTGLASVTAGETDVFSRGVGGDGGEGSNGSGGAGGSATGGIASLLVDTGSSLSGTIYLGMTNASGGMGGTGSSARGDGGSAQSGHDSATIDGSVTYGGTADAHDGFIVTSFADGGAGGIGGSASAGSSTIDVAGSLTVAGQVQASAQAGGGGGDTTGGTGRAGSASITVPGTLDAATLVVLNNATGGLAAIGGDAYGGTASLSVDGGSMGVSNLSLEASATGGDGVTHGGNAQGGQINFILDGGSATIETIANLDASAIAGNASNGTGGDALGGIAYTQSLAGGTLDGSEFAGTANANGGNGTTAGGARGGSVSLLSDSFSDDGVTRVAFDDVTLSADGRRGTGATNGETAGVAGTVVLASFGGRTTAGTLSLSANGTDYGGQIYFQNGPDFEGQPGSMDFGSVVANANGGDFAGSIFVYGASGMTLDLGEATFTADGGFNGGGIFLLAGGCNCTGGDGETAPPQATTGGGIAATNLTLNTTGNISVALTQGADVSVSDTLIGNAGALISLTDDGTGGAIRTHEIDLTAISIIDQADLIADIINFTTSGSMTIGDLSAGDRLTLTAGGDLTTGNLSAGNNLSLRSRSNIAAGDLDARNVTVDADGSLSVGDVDAQASATFTAGGLAQFTGVVESPTITVTSADIDVTDGASLGVYGLTNVLTLNAVSSGQPIVIGEDGSEGGEAQGQYVLNEDGDVHASQIVINAVADGDSAAPDILVHNVQVDGSATQGGGTRQVTVNTSGSVLVDGVVDYTDAGADDRLTINAGHALAVNTDTGGIQITDGAGALAGILELNADNVWVGTGALLSQLEANSSFEGRDAALLSGTGTNPDGFLRAGTIAVGISDTFFVQNSNTLELFGGVDTGDGGLSVTNTGNGPVTVIAFGRQTLADGTVLTNQDFINSVDTLGQGGFTDDSAVNGCALGGSCGGTVDTPPGAPPGIDFASILGPIGDADSPSDAEDQDSDDSDDADEGDGSNLDPNLRLINTTPINRQYQIDEPVTSGGDVVVGNP